MADTPEINEDGVLITQEIALEAEQIKDKANEYFKSMS